MLVSVAKHYTRKAREPFGDMLARLMKSRDARLVGALGASEGGEARAKSLTPKIRSTIAQNAAKARWKIND